MLISWLAQGKVGHWWGLLGFARRCRYVPWPPPAPAHSGQLAGLQHQHAELGGGVAQQGVAPSRTPVLAAASRFTAVRARATRVVLAGWRRASAAGAAKSVVARAARAAIFLLFSSALPARRQTGTALVYSGGHSSGVGQGG